VDPKVRFDDGAAYERMMGVWSRMAGEVFLDWLALPSGLRCIDVGCGNGAFTELFIERCTPTEIHGIDLSPAQLDFAKARPGARLAHFREGDAMALPFSDNSFDVSVMALVIFFVPEPQKGVAEMARVVRPGGTVASYAWEMPAGFPLEPLYAEVRAVAHKNLAPPHPEASHPGMLRELWTGAGLQEVEIRQIAVERTFADFDEFWEVSTASGAIKPTLAAMVPSDIETVKNRVRAKLPADASGRITYGAWAHAVKGRVPA
jgi:SAM-dependent methyltransferase